MLGEHDGLTPLEDPATDLAPALRVMGRLGAGADVPFRKKLVTRAASRIQAEDRHWVEAFASHLAADGGIDAIPAHAVAFAMAWELREDELARMIRRVNTMQQDEYVRQVITGMRAAAPEFGRRLLAGRIDSDEVFIRVAISHLFRRDPKSTFQMFVVDGVAQTLPKALKRDLTSFVRSCLERFDEEAVPEAAWGYVVVLRDMNSRGGFYLMEPTEEARTHLAEIDAKMRDEFGIDDETDRLNHMAAAAVSGHLFAGNAGAFASMMSAIFERLDIRHAVLYARDDKSGPEGGGVHSQLIRIPGETIDEARRMVAQMPEVRMHDDFRRLTEFFEQERDRQERRPDA